MAPVRQTCLVAAGVSLASTASVSAVSQDGVDDAIEEVVIVGTRRQDRTVVDTAVPIDVLDASLIESVPAPELLDVLTKLVPSLNVERFVLGDGASMIRPPSLRGLDSDKTLILVNGKRRHRGALVQLAGNGSHGPDLTALPSIALRNVEVLRDGASAMYGSDAIAGVINFNLRNDAQGGELRAQYGQYTAGNESSVVISANAGLPLGGSGFINLSVEFSDEEQTSRGTFFDRTIGSSGLTPAESALVSGLFDHDGDPGTPEQQRFGPDAVTEVWSNGQLVTILNGSDGIPDDTDSRFADNLSRAEISSDDELVQVWGRPNREAVALVVNAGLDLAGGTMLYAWGNFAENDTDRNMAHRRVGVGSLRMLREPDASIYDPRDQFPAGFTPRFFGNVVDQSIVAGWRGRTDAELGFDLGARYGSSELVYSSRNTRNPSLGPDSPTVFQPGSLESEEMAIAADFTWPLNLDFAGEAVLAFGLEIREESYGSRGGDPASWAAGPYIVPDPWDWETSAAPAVEDVEDVAGMEPPGLENVGMPCPAGDPINNVFNVGSDGFPGYGPLSVFRYERTNQAGYVDLESDLSERWLVAIAGRYEKYSDFGENFSVRLASRFELTNRIAVRGSIGTGFRAPSAGQISTINVQGRPGTTTDPFLVGIFPATHPGARVFGSVPLDAETSEQFTLGMTARVCDSMSVAIDYYHIALDDRLWLSRDFRVGPEERAVLIESGVPGANGIEFVRFFNNDVDTRTQGVDLVTSYDADWSAGNTRLSIIANWNRTEVTRRTDRPGGPFVSDSDAFNIRNQAPYPRAVIDARHTWNRNLVLLLRGNWFGRYTIENSQDPTEFQEYDTLIQVDALLQLGFADSRYRLTVGANNIFDALPDPAQFGVCCGLIVSRGSLVDWQGPFYYLRGEFHWD